MSNAIDPFQEPGHSTSHSPLRPSSLDFVYRERKTESGSLDLWRKHIEAQGLILRSDWRQRIEAWRSLKHPRLANWAPQTIPELLTGGRSSNSAAHLLEKGYPLPALLVATLMVQTLEGLQVLEQAGLDIPALSAHQLKIRGPGLEALLQDPSRDPKTQLCDVSLLTLLHERSFPLLFATFEDPPPEVLRGHPERSSAVHSLGGLARKLLAPSSQRRRWFRHSRLIRLAEQMHAPSWRDRPQLNEAKEQVRSIAMELFAENYRQRRIHELESALDEALKKEDVLRVETTVLELAHLKHRTV